MVPAGLSRLRNAPWQLSSSPSFAAVGGTLLGCLNLSLGHRGVAHSAQSFAAVPSDFDVLAPPEEEGHRPALVEAYDETGFTVGGQDFSGPVICLGSNLALHWDCVKHVTDIAPDSLAVFEIVRPRPELLILGCGASASGAQRALSTESRDYLRRLGMKVEILSTRHAAATHNFLSQEGRNVAAALLLPNSE